MAVVVVVMLDITPGDIQYVDGEFSAFRDSSSSNYFGLVVWFVGWWVGVRVSDSFSLKKTTFVVCGC